MTSVSQKRCTKCGEEKPATLEFFGKNTQGKNGLDPRCRMCLRINSENARRKNGIQKRTPPRYAGENGQRRCTKCLNQYPPTLEYFHQHRGFPNNLDLWCRECKRTSERDRARNHSEENAAKASAWYYANYEYAKEAKRDYHERHRDRDNKRNNDYYHLNKHNPEFVLRSKASAKKSRGKNKSKRQESKRLWRFNNPEKSRAQVRNRRAKLRNAEGSHTDHDVALQYKSQNGKCWWCGKSVGNNYHVDHRIAIERGGTNWPNNLCISCPSCNTSKTDKMPWEWNGRLL